MVTLSELKGKRICVTGGRHFGEEDFDDNWFESRETLEEILELLAPVGLGVGCAKGADRIAREWGQENEDLRDFQVFYADWKNKGRAAGPIRNRAMLNGFKPDFLLAAPGDRGTEDCMGAAKKLGIPVYTIGQILEMSKC